MRWGEGILKSNKTCKLGEKVNFKVKLSKILMINALLKWNLRFTIGV